jgi:membrane protein
VLVGTVLILVNVGITVTLGMVKDFGLDFLGLTGPALGFSEQFFALVVAFASLWVFVLLIYRFVPADRTPWRVALVAATFTALVLEVMKYGFGWYVISAADYRSTYGNLATLAVLLFWIYYGAVAFVLGGEVAHVHGERTELATDPGPSFGVNVRP